MNDWWKSPVLYGDDNDYGQYDYMIEEIPKDYAKWEFDKECKCPCHNCKRETHLLFRAEHFFHTMDGWDSLDYAECWRCWLKGEIYSIKCKLKKDIKNKIEVLKLTFELHKTAPNKGFKYCYGIAKMIVR